MDEQSILRAAPLLQGQLLDRREEVESNLVKYVLAGMEQNQQFTIEHLQVEIQSQLNADLDPTTISSALEYLSEDGHIDHISEKEYIIENDIDLKTVESLINPVWEEFKSRLIESEPDYDRYIDSNVKPAFTEFLETFFLELAQASQELAEFEKESFFSNDFSYLIESIAESNNVKKDDMFVKEVIGYLNEPGEELIHFTNVVYSGIINLDIVSQASERIIDLRDVDQTSKKIFLDTNVLVSLFCTTDKTHPIVATACERAVELGYDLYYLPQTADEMTVLIENTIEELTTLNPDRDFDRLTDSQFVEYFAKEYDDPGEFASDLENWESELSATHNVSIYDADEVEISKDIAGFIKRTLSQFAREQQGHEPQRKINHDTALVSIPATIRASLTNDNNIPSGPFVLSRDSQVTRISNIGKGTYWSRNIALQPRSWVNFLMAFSPADIQGGYDDVAIALLRGAAETDYEEIGIDEYSTLLAAKTSIDKEILSDYLNQHAVTEELSEALSRGDGSKAEQLVIEALEGEYPNRFEKEEELLEEKEELEARVSEVVDKLKSKNEKLDRTEEQLDSLRDAVGGGNNIQVNFEPENDIELSSNAVSQSEATAIATNEQEIKHEIEGIIDLLDASLSDGIEESDAPDPPENKTNWSEVTQWLEDLSTWLVATDQLTSGADFLQSKIPEIMEAIKSIL